MTFGEAVEKVKRGVCCRRKEWPLQSYLCRMVVKRGVRCRRKALQSYLCRMVPPGEKDPGMIMQCWSGTFVPTWVPTWTDILADDWEAI